jgi:poly(A) polymerase
MLSMAQPARQSMALSILRRLRRAGYETYFAGGCVRDRLMGRRTSDYDIATSATPQQVRKLFRHVVLVGAQFGVAVVVDKKQTVEVATFRSECGYSDGRRPDTVTYSSPREDALRRDFTINGMFYDPMARKIIDYVGGQEDLAAGVIRTIGKPTERFGEDYLRMIRAVRFAVRFDFAIEQATERAIRRHASSITKISGERVFDELSKMLALPSAGGALAQLHAVGLARHVLPELFTANQWSAALDRVAALASRKDVTLAMMALFCELPARTIRKRMRHWGAPNRLRDAVLWAHMHRDRWALAADLPLCDFKRLMAGEHFERLRQLWRVREQAQTGKAGQCLRIARRVNRIAPARIAPEPFVTGADLIAMGLKEGKALGDIHKALYDAQLNETLPTRRAALAEARRRIADAQV